MERQKLHFFILFDPSILLRMRIRKSILPESFNPEQTASDQGVYIGETDDFSTYFFGISRERNSWHTHGFKFE